MKLTVILMTTLLALSSSVAYGAAPAVSQTESTVDKINVLPHGFPLKVVPFTDADGKSHDFSQYRGKVLLVNMWATWCPPCVRELPALQRLGKKFDQSKFALLPISIDQGGKEQVQAFLLSLGMPEFTSFYDPRMALEAIFPLDTIPATFIIDGKGTLIGFVRTFVDWDDPKAESLLKDIIQRQQPQTEEKSTATSAL